MWIKSNRYNSMQIFIHCKTTLRVSGVTAPIIRSIKNCTRSFRYRSYYLYRYSTPTWSDWDWFVRVESHKPVPIRLRCSGVAVQVVWPVPEAAVHCLILLMMGAVTPETCRVVLQWINICILLHLLDFYSHWIMMHGTMSLKFLELIMDLWKSTKEIIHWVNQCLLFINSFPCLTTVRFIAFSKPSSSPHRAT